MGIEQVDTDYKKKGMNFRYSLLVIITIDVILSIIAFAPWDNYHDLLAMLGFCMIAFWVNIICGSIAILLNSKTRKFGLCLLLNSIIVPIAILGQTLICNGRDYYKVYGPQIDYTFTRGDWGYMLTFYERDSIFEFSEGDFRDSRNTHWYPPTKGKYTIPSDNAFHFYIKEKECIVRNDSLINYYTSPIPLSKDNALVKFMNR